MNSNDVSVYKNINKDNIRVVMMEMILLEW